MSLNELRDKAFNIAQEHGFHKKPCDLPTRLMLIVSELSEAMEADRKGIWCHNPELLSGKHLLELTINELQKSTYESSVKGTVEEEIADAIIRLLDLAGVYNINLDWHVAAKMAYNEKREYKHGKKY